MARPDAADTKDRILDAAEVLFSECGFSGASMRAITAAAAVNVAAAHYHFGSKEALLEAVLSRRLGPINVRRVEAVRRVVEEAAPGAPGIEEVLHALFDPAFESIGDLGESGTRFVRLAGRMHADPNSHVRDLFLAQFREVVPAFRDALGRALPDQEPEAVSCKMAFVLGAMAHTLGGIGSADERSGVGCRDASSDPGGVRDALVAFCAAGLRAQAPAAARGTAR